MHCPNGTYDATGVHGAPLRPGASAKAAPCAGHGPGAARMLFFSGGSALKETARELKHRAPLCVHLVTPFDSGGSSAVLRKAFAMPAVGDMRSRLLALSDENRPGVREVFTLLSYRLQTNTPQKQNRAELVRLTNGSHPLMCQIPEPQNAVLRDHLRWFAAHMPEDFALEGACLGNLFLAAGYLRANNTLGPVITLLSRLVHARGIVRPVVEQSAQLAVRLENGQSIIGQARFTGKAGAPVNSPIREIWLTQDEHGLNPLPPEAVVITPRIAKLVARAQSICYPIGSFYSSLIANLLPGGVAGAIAECAGPKILVPNPGKDPELLGHTLEDQIDTLLDTLGKNAPGAAAGRFLSHVLVDTQSGHYAGGIPHRRLEALGISLVDRPFIYRDKPHIAHPRLLAEALLDISGRK
ncbi:GAK system CofD-like protein [Desulfovibrio sp. OttesenSCG-928-G15]|nr:GAK system CofD-like protein [Desulfovibrio sp. OttesenSCG-928-G15]